MLFPRDRRCLDTGTSEALDKFAETLNIASSTTKSPAEPPTDAINGVPAVVVTLALEAKTAGNFAGDAGIDERAGDDAMCLGREILLNFPMVES